MDPHSEVSMMAVALPQHRPTDQLAVPFPRWRVALIFVLGLVLSGAGWIGYDRVSSAQAEAGRLAVVASAESRDADMSALDGNEGRALAWLVVYRCDSGQLRDAQLCDAAHKITR
jgi:hypothetical protein